MQIHTCTHTVVPVQSCSIPVSSGLQLQGKSQGWRVRAVHCLQWRRCTIQLQSAAAHGHPPSHSIKNADQQTHTSACIHVDLMSWPLLGPHVVGVFSYGAGNGSEESEQCCRPGDKRQRGPGSRAKEAPGPAPWTPRSSRSPLKQPGVRTGGTLWKCRSTLWNGSNKRIQSGVGLSV